MAQFNFFKKADCYRPEFSLRSCANCDMQRGCVSIKDKDWRTPWLDCAKCGCKLYHNETIMKKEAELAAEKENQDRN